MKHSLLFLALASSLALVGWSCIDGEDPGGDLTGAPANGHPPDLRLPSDAGLDGGLTRRSGTGVQAPRLTAAE
jgi:hypothetical protein